MSFSDKANKQNQIIQNQKLQYEQFDTSLSERTNVDMNSMNIKKIFDLSMKNQQNNNIKQNIDINQNNTDYSNKDKVQKKKQIQFYMKIMLDEMKNIPAYKGVNFKKFETYSQYLQEMKSRDLSNIQGKCSHNSYDKGSYYNQLKFSANTAYQGGCIMLEFDIVHKMNKNDNSYVFFISHDENYIVKERLSQGLQQVYKYHKNNKDHLPIFLTINLKDWLLNQYDIQLNYQDFFENLEEQFLQIFEKDDIFIPKQLLRGEKDLFRSIQKKGQIKIKNLLGKIILILDGAFENLDNIEFINMYHYYLNDISNKLMFTTLDSRIIQCGYYESIEQYMESTGSYNQIFINIKADLYYDDDRSGYMKGLQILKEAQQLKFITRGYNLNNVNQYMTYRDMQMNFLCTDNVYNTEYAVAY